MTERIISSRYGLRVVKDKCVDREGYNHYVARVGRYGGNDIVCSLECAVNEGGYDDARGLFHPFNQSQLDWLNRVMEREYGLEEGA